MSEESSRLRTDSKFAHTLSSTQLLQLCSRIITPTTTPSPWFLSEDGWGYQIEAEKGFIPCAPHELLFSGDRLKFDNEQVGVRVLSPSRGEATPLSKSD